jgi:hypothetical protein
VAVVGTAYVRIEAITAGLERDIQRAIDKATKSTTTKKSGEKIGEDLGKAINAGLDKHFKSVGSQSTQRAYGASLAKNMADGFDSYDFGGHIGESMDDAIDKSRAQFERAGEMAGGSMGDGISRGISKAVGGGKGGASGAGGGISLTGLIKPLAIAGLVAPALQLINAFVAQTIALLGAIGPAMDAVGAVGLSMMLALRTQIGLVTLAMQWQGPAALVFQERMKSITNQVGHLVGRQLFPRLSAAMEALHERVLPDLNHELSRTGIVVGNLALKAVALADSKMFKPELAEFLRGNAQVFERLGDILLNVVQIVVRVVNEARPLTLQFLKWASAASEAAVASVTLGQETGGLAKHFRHAGDIAAQLGRVLKNTWDALANIFNSGAIPQGERLLQTLEDVTAEFERWTDSMSGQNALQEWFSGASEPMEAFWRFAGAIGTAIGDLVGGKTTALIGLLDALTGLVPALATILSSSQAFTILLSTMLTTLTPAINLIADLMLQFDGIIAMGALIVAAFKGVTIIVGLFAPVVTAAKTAMQLFRVQMALAPAGMSAFSVATGVAATAVKGFMLSLGPIVLAITAIVTAFTFWKQGQAEAKAASDELGDTLNELTGEYTKNTAALIENRLEEDGTAQAARDLGLNINDLVGYTRGHEGAVKRVNAVLRENEKDLSEVTGRSIRYSGAMTDAESSANTLRDGLGGVTGDLDEQTLAWENSRAGIRAHWKEASNLEPAGARLVTVTERLGEGIGVQAQQHRDAAAAIRAQMEAQLALNNLALENLNTNVAYQAQLDALHKEFKNGKGSLNAHTEAGREGITAMTSYIAAADAVTGSEKHRIAVMTQARQEVYKMALSVFDNAKRAREWTDANFKGTEAVDANARATGRWAEAMKRGKGPADDLRGVSLKQYRLLEAQTGSAKELKAELEKLGAAQDRADANTKRYGEALENVSGWMDTSKGKAADLLEKYDLFPRDITTKAEFEKAVAEAKRDDLVGKYDKVQPKVTTKAELDVEGALDSAFEFVNGINLEFLNIKDPQVKIQVDTAQMANINDRLGGVGRAMGGPIRGPGSGTSDSILARLSNGEHVLTAREVAAAGGHEAVARMRHAIITGTAPRFATGGPVGGTKFIRRDVPGGTDEKIQATMNVLLEEARQRKEDRIEERKERAERKKERQQARRQARREPEPVTSSGRGSSVTNNFTVHATSVDDLLRQVIRISRHRAVGGVSTKGRK